MTANRDLRVLRFGLVIAFSLCICARLQLKGTNVVSSIICVLQKKSDEVNGGVFP